MRIRTVKPEFFLDEDVAARPPLERLLFAALWLQADRAGRLEDRPARIKALGLPYDDVNCEELLSGLAEARFIQRYEVDGRKYIQIRTFEAHQRPNTREPQSTLPAPPVERTHVQARARARKHMRAAVEREGNGKGMEYGKGMEGKGNGERQQPAGDQEIIPSGTLDALEQAAGVDAPGVEVVIPARTRAESPKLEWLQPFGDAWTARWGIGQVPPWGEMAQAFKGPREELGDGELLTRWTRFLGSRDRSMVAQPDRFVAELSRAVPGPGERSGPPTNPLVTGRRAELVEEGYALIRDIAYRTREDPEETAARASAWKGTRKLNLAAASDDRLLNTVLDLRKRKEDLDAADTSGPVADDVAAAIKAALEWVQERGPRADVALEIARWLKANRNGTETTEEQLWAAWCAETGAPPRVRTVIGPDVSRAERALREADHPGS